MFKFMKDDEQYQEVSDLFKSLKKMVKENSEDESNPGFGGMFTAEEKKSFNDIQFTMHDGGYNQVLQSTVFEFKIEESYTYQDGTTFNFYNGSVKDLKEAHDHTFSRLNKPERKMGI